VFFTNYFYFSITVFILILKNSFIHSLDYQKSLQNKYFVFEFLYIKEIKMFITLKHIKKFEDLKTLITDDSLKNQISKRNKELMDDVEK